MTELSIAEADYPYLQILQRLQSTALENESTTTATTTNDQWDLSSDPQLATLLNEFTNHIVARTHHVSCDIRAVQNSVNNVGVNVALVQTEFMKRSSDIFMEQVVGDDDEEEESSSSSSSDDIISDEKGEDNIEETKSKLQKQEEEEDDGDDSDNSSADIARLELEEQSAISDGMKALNLFFDVNKRKSPPPPNNGSDSESGNNGGGEQATMLSMNVEEDMIGDNCYFYQAAEDDGFNQRPLPFMIGSREFMEASSSSAG